MLLFICFNCFIFSYLSTFGLMICLLYFSINLCNTQLCRFYFFEFLFWEVLLKKGQWSLFEFNFSSEGVSLVAQLVKNLPAMWETWIRPLGWDDPLEKGKATHSSFLAWEFHGLFSHGVTKSWTRLNDFQLRGIKGWEAVHPNMCTVDLREALLSLSSLVIRV